MSPSVFVCRSCFGIFGNWQQLFDHKKKYRRLDDDWNGIQFPHRSDPNAVHHCDHDGCGRQFVDLRSLTKHKRTHSKPFQCTALIRGGVACGKSFGNKRNLKIHARSHRNDRREKCSFCGLTFCDPSTLRKHVQRVHTGDPRPYSCRLCLKRFAQKHALQQHLAIHSNDGGRHMFSCHSCDMTFTVKSNRDRHQKKYHGDSGGYNADPLDIGDDHGGDQLFHCVPCGKSWTRKSDKARHDHYHHSKDTNPRTISGDNRCDICDLTFAQKSGKGRHDKRFHARSSG